MSSHRASDPMSLTYLKVLSIFMLSMGAWPRNVLTIDEKISRGRWWYLCFLKIEASFSFVAFLYYLILYFTTLSFVDLGDKLITICLDLMTWYRISLPFNKEYGIIAGNLIKKFHLIHFKDMGYYNNKINDQINRLSHYFTLFMAIWVFSAMTLFNLAPIYNNYSHGVSPGYRPANYSIQFSLYYAIPGFSTDDHYIIISIFNYWLSYVCTVVVCVNDIYLCLLVFQIIGHIKTLKYNLDNFPKPKGQTAIEGNCDNALLNCEKFNYQENKMIRYKLKEIIEHHKLIDSFTGDLSDFFGPVLGLNYLFQLASCCLLLLECSSGEPGALARYAPLTVAVFYQLAQFSITFEVVGSESERLKDAVYGMPWESMNTSNQRTVCYLLHRVQTPIQVTAMGMTAVGVQTMGKILKTTFSYYTFLQTIE